MKSDNFKQAERFLKDTKRFYRQLNQLQKQTGLKRYLEGYPAILLLTAMGIAAVSCVSNEKTPKQSTQRASEALLAQKEAVCGDIVVVDGDSIKALCEQERIMVRLYGIDAPEMKQAPYGERAKKALAMALPDKVRIKFYGLDFYQRMLGELYVKERNINEQMVREGYAVAYADSKTQKRYKQAQQQAQQEKLGVWQKAGDHQDPKTWRRYH